MKVRTRSALGVLLVLLIALPTAAQSISFGNNGVSLRGSRGVGVSIGRSGVRIRQPQVRTHVPTQHGVVIQEQVPRTQQQQHLQPLYQQPQYPKQPSQSGSVILGQGVHVGQGVYAGQGVVVQGQPVQAPTRAANNVRTLTTGNFIVTNPQATAYQAAAERALKSGDLSYAAQSVTMAIKKDRRNGLLRLFAAHVFFATGNYPASARELEFATQLVPANHWGMVARNVHRIDSRQHFEAQMEQLTRYLDKHPNSPDARVLYGFYSSVDGQSRVAADQFFIVLNFEPNHTLAKRLQTSFNARPHSVEANTKTRHVGVRTPQNDVASPEPPRPIAIPKASSQKDSQKDSAQETGLNSVLIDLGP